MLEFLTSIKDMSLGSPMMTFILITLGFSLLMFFLSWKTGKSFSFSLGPFKLALGGKKKDNIDRAVLIESVETIVREKVEEISHIKNLDTINKQMKYADERIIEIKSTVTNRYAKQLESELPDTEAAKTHKDYRSYQILVGLLTNNLSDKISQFLIENHILDYSDVEWEDYITEKSDLIVTMACDFIDVMYDCNNSNLISLRDLSDGNQDTMNTVRAIIKLIFRRARFIAQDSQKKIETLEKEIHDHLDILKGVNENKKDSLGY